MLNDAQQKSQISFDIEMCREDDDYGGNDDDTDAGNSIAAREKASWIRVRLNTLRIHRSPETNAE